LTTGLNALDRAAHSHLLVLTGTTGSGKTEVSIPLAKCLKGEIINADSRQVYRELEIGTAKPSAAELAEIPHHLVNHVSIHDRWTAGDFARAAAQIIKQIIDRNHVPIIVGGSMLYLKALLVGFFDEAEIEAVSYVELRGEIESRGLENLFAELQESDPDLAARTDPNDHHRILRGLAVFRQTGKRLSELQKQIERPVSNPYRLYFLHGDRQETYDRVNQRARMMIDTGLVEEAKALLDQGFNETNCNALKAHGYQEIFPYLRGEITRDAMLENIQKAVRHYVKRQHTWFRRVEETRWIERSFSEAPEQVAKRISDDFLS
jgi:tRNA dimethylallyltransferase